MKMLFGSVFKKALIILKEVLKERAAEGMTVFLSTHQISVAEEVADRIGIIHMGKLVAVGTKEELHAISGRGKVALEENELSNVNSGWSPNDSKN